MAYWKSFGLALFAAVGLLSEAIGSARAETATEWSVVPLSRWGVCRTPRSQMRTPRVSTKPGRPAGLHFQRSPCHQRSRAGGGGHIVDGVEIATEWIGGNVINLGGLPGFTSSVAEGVNDTGQVVGESIVGGLPYATEWSDGNVINLDFAGSLANGINNLGQVVGESNINGLGTATEWSDGSIISLGSLPGFTGSSAAAINDAGQAVGISEFPAPPATAPEPSTWAMMLIGFAGLGLAGYRLRSDAN